MRLLPAVALASFALVGPARADSFPQMIVDRPLVLWAGMTSADVGIDFPTYQTGLSSHTALGDYHDLDFSLHHAFGGVQLGVQFVDSFQGPIVSAGVRAMLGPGALDLDTSFRLPTDASGIDHEDGAAARYVYKAIVAPGTFAVYMHGGVSAAEYSFVDQYPYPMSGHRIAVSAEGGIELQLAPEVTATLGANAVVPIDDTMNGRASPAAGGQLTYVFDRFDVYANLWVYDLFKVRLPYAGVGVVTRFGG